MILFLPNTQVFLSPQMHSLCVVDHTREKENASIKGDGGTAGLTENPRVLRHRMMT